ncbi:MAG: hypothetical protein WC795_00265 [Candidatus Paceibacterota bacterium]
MESLILVVVTYANKEVVKRYKMDLVYFSKEVRSLLRGKHSWFFASENLWIQSKTGNTDQEVAEKVVMGIKSSRIACLICPHHRKEELVAKIQELASIEIYDSEFPLNESVSENELYIVKFFYNKGKLKKSIAFRLLSFRLGLPLLGADPGEN